MRQLGEGEACRRGEANASRLFEHAETLPSSYRRKCHQHRRCRESDRRHGAQRQAKAIMIYRRPKQRQLTSLKRHAHRSPTPN